VIKFFSVSWNQVPVVFIDTETTGTKPGRDRTVQIGFARFEGGVCVAHEHSLVNPGVPIPESATEIHGIRDADVVLAPTLETVFASERVAALLEGAQPAAYNAPFDRHFVPPFGDDWTWPWLDTLSLVRVVDRYAKGKGRHKLGVTCERHSVALPSAHDAGADARAAGELFYKLMPKIDGLSGYTLGQLLRWQREQEADEWFRFMGWLSKQPPKPEAQP
jgi:DNA polymerase-3 subunit epsilon